MTIPDNIKHIIDSLKDVCISNNCSAYLHGDLVYYFITQKNAYLKTNTIKIIVSHNFEFKILNFYKSLTKYFTINEEVENTPEKYIVISKPFVFEFSLYLDKTLPFIQQNIGKFKTDSIVFDIQSDQLIDYKNSIYLSEDRKQIAYINKYYKQWDTEDVLDLIMMLGLGFNISSSDIKSLSSIKLKNLSSPVDYKLTDYIIRLLLSHEPGTVIKFIIDTFSDGKSWLLENLIETCISLDVYLSEDISVDILSQKRLELINAYSDFFLNQSTDIESAQEKKDRLTTLMRVLFDVPNLEIKTTYIDRMSLMTAEIVESGPQSENSMSAMSFQPNVMTLFASPPICEYGQCPPCDPASCEEQGKSPCCCCHTVDIISVANFRCHKAIALSCNHDGTAPGPNNADFPENCHGCTNACEVVLGSGSHAGMDCDDLIGTGTDEGWWKYPTQFSPCECACKSGDPDDCQLTCVTCSGLFCTSESNISGSDCNYHISLTPGSGCCGNPKNSTLHFVIDNTSEMAGDLSSVKDKVIQIAQGVIDSGINPSFLAEAWFGIGISTFQPTNLEENNLENLTLWLNSLVAVVSPDLNGDGFDTCANRAGVICQSGFIKTINNPELSIDYITIYITSSSEVNLPCEYFGQGVGDYLTQHYTRLVNMNREDDVQLFCITNGDDQFNTICSLLGGRTFNISDNWVSLLSDINITVNSFPTSCDCIDYTPIPLRLSSSECKCCTDGIIDPCIDDPTDHACLSSLPEFCYNIPIKKCLTDQNCQDPSICALPIALNACGQTITITPERASLVCCSDIGFGCDCEIASNPICCGPTCPGMEVCDQNGNKLFNTLKEAQDAIWCECFSVSSFAENSNCVSCCCPDIQAGRGDPNFPCDQLEPTDELLQETPPRCCPCPTEFTDACCNCCLHFGDGLGGFSVVKCRHEIDQEVLSIWTNCSDQDEEELPPGPIGGGSEEFISCSTDDCIVGEPTGPLDENRCDDAHKGCTTIRHPSVVMLNNGIGLVAYESSDSVSTIKIQQFKSSSKHKILPNREFNFGILQNIDQWVNNQAKLYYFDDLPQHLITSQSNINISDPSTWHDRIAFRTGPLQSQVFPLIGNPVYGEDSNGRFLTFLVPENIELTGTFNSSDDVYNVKWFLLDSDDIGLVGDATDTTTTGQDLIITDNSYVNDILLLQNHIFNGKAVPVANPTLDALKNYSNGLENSHFVYLTYQALEDSKWNIYIRQIRLSEYKKYDSISTGQQIVSLDELGIIDILYRVVCVYDECSASDNNFVSKRNAVFQLFLEDGREVVNPGLTGYWTNLCSGVSDSNYSKQYVFAKLSNIIVTNKCPTTSEMNSVFYNWKVGQEYMVAKDVNSASSLLSSVAITNDNSIPLGNFSSPLVYGNTSVYSSLLDGSWYSSLSESTWSSIGGLAYDTLNQFKGIDVAEPILLSEGESQHCTHPVVKTNYNNDIFVVYECSEKYSSSDDSSEGSVNIKIIGTNNPTASLPVGISQSYNPDINLDYFLSPSNFIYSDNIAYNGVNQLPSVYSDLNDVIHVTWQSNRDGQWEIYYANSTDDFKNIRITNNTNKSLYPSIDGDVTGRLYITWHDNRFGNWEILLAHLIDRRIVPLYQQDPYLSSLHAGYRHYDDNISLYLKNNTSEILCINDLLVNFYDDRLFENFVLTIKQSDYPFAFVVPNSQNDSTNKVFTEFSDWSCYFSEDDEYNTCDPYCNQFVCYSPEFDTLLGTSVIESVLVQLSDLGFGESLEISFRGSEIEHDLNAALQWTDYKLFTNSGFATYDSLGLSTVTGRYKQIRARTTLTDGIVSTSVENNSDIETVDDDGYISDTATSTLVWHQGEPTLSIRANTFTVGENKIYLRFPVNLPGPVAVIEKSEINIISSTSSSGILNSRIRMTGVENVSDINWPIDAPSSIDTPTIEFEIGDTISGDTLQINIQEAIEAFMESENYSPGNKCGVVAEWIPDSIVLNDPERIFYSGETPYPPKLLLDYHLESMPHDEGYKDYPNVDDIWNPGGGAVKLASNTVSPGGTIGRSSIFVRYPIRFDKNVHMAVYSAAIKINRITPSVSGVNTSLRVSLLHTDDAITLNWSEYDADNPTPIILSQDIDVNISNTTNIDVTSLVFEFVERTNVLWLDPFERGKYIGIKIEPINGTFDVDIESIGFYDGGARLSMPLVIDFGLKGTHQLRFGRQVSESTWATAPLGPLSSNLDIPAPTNEYAKLYFKIPVFFDPPSFGVNDTILLSNSLLRLKHQGFNPIINTPVTFKLYLANSSNVTSFWVDSFSFVAWRNSLPAPKFELLTMPSEFGTIQQGFLIPIYIPLIDAIEEFVSSPGYSHGNHMAIMIQRDTGQGSTAVPFAINYESEHTFINGLTGETVEFLGGPLIIGQQTSLNNSSDAAFLWEHGNDGTWHQGSYLVVSSSSADNSYGKRSIFLRFPASDAAENIQSSIIELTSLYDSSGTLPIEIYLLNSGDVYDDDWSEGSNPTTARSAYFLSSKIDGIVSGEKIQIDVTSLVEAFIETLRIDQDSYIGIEISWSGEAVEGEISKIFHSAETDASSTLSSDGPKLFFYTIAELSGEDDGYKEDRLSITRQWHQYDEIITVAKNIDGSSMTSSIFLRFKVDISNLTEINNAFLNLSPSMDFSGNFGAIIYLLDIDDARQLDWTNTLEISSIPTRLNGISFEITSLTQNTYFTTPSILDILTDYINRDGYIPGNYIGLEIAWNEENIGDDNFCSFYSKEAEILSSKSAPYLQLFITEDLPLDIYFPLTRLEITSTSLFRLCLSPGEEVVATLDLTPSIRIDEFGNTTGQSNLPIPFEKNRTYFISLDVSQDDGTLTAMPHQNSSASCFECNGEIGDWDLKSCSIEFAVTNDTDELLYYNFQVDVYFDKEKQKILGSFSAFYNNDDLAYFTVNNNIPANESWSSEGFRIKSRETVSISFWPHLSPMIGLLCGISYYVDIKYCQNNVGSCSELDLENFSSMKWKCDCQSVRWNGGSNSSYKNINQLLSWNSSGFGRFDTRITETIYDNIRPIIKLRSFGQGVILYLSNRRESILEPNNFQIYASVFDILPGVNMYASGAQSITSPFAQLIHRSDIPICKDTGSCHNNNALDEGLILKGYNHVFTIDQFDNIFVAFEEKPQECSEFEVNKSSIVKVHRCGIYPNELFQLNTEENSNAFCSSEYILEQSYKTSYSKDFNLITKLIRVHENYVKSQIYRKNLLTTVVDVCEIEFIVIGPPGSIAVRLRNGSNADWSIWNSLNTEIGEDTVIIKHKLSNGSGLKFVDFQFAAASGLTGNGTVALIADYTKVEYSIKMYKPLQDTPVPQNDSIDVVLIRELSSNENIWVDGNRVSSINNMPIASIRPIKVEVDSIINESIDFVFIEILPSIDYMAQFSNISDEIKNNGSSNIEPTFSVLQQGDDQFDIPTIWLRDVQGREVFRGVFIVHRDNATVFKDGLSSIVPNFKNDCSNSNLSYQTSTYNNDVFNIITDKKTNDDNIDLLNKERDLTGNIKYKITLRPNEDPYLVFGNSNYRL